MDINKALFRLSKEITESEFNNPLLIGIPRRGDLLAKRLSNNLIQFNYSHDLDTVDYLPVIGRDLDRAIVCCMGFSLVHVMSYGRDVFTWVAVRLRSSL